MERVITRILDRYFAKKVVSCAREHIERKYGCRSSFSYDKTLGEYVVEAAWQKDNTWITQSYLEFFQKRSVEVLFALLVEGWKNIDIRFETRLSQAGLSRPK